MATSSLTGCFPSGKLYWGIECADGWFDLIETIFKLINWELKHDDKCEPVEVKQIKEKFGQLRFYYAGGNEAISNYVTFAESFSGLICEKCGNKARLDNSSGWYSTLCNGCKK